MKHLPVIAVAALAGAGLCAVVADGIYIVDEGHAAVITHWGRAVGQEGPQGIQFKMPMMTRVREFDVRERRTWLDAVSAATANQLPITASISVNWRMDSNRVMEVYVNYGSPEQFEANILAPRLLQATKAGLSEFQASDLIGDRTQAANTILSLLADAMVSYPASVLSLQIENVELPERYLEAVMAKEEAREGAAREKYNLDRQKLEAQREVQTAEAERQAAIARAEGRAQATRLQAKADAEAVELRGAAEAAAIRVVEKALAGNPLLIEYERAKRWNGQMPSTVLGGDPGILMNLPLSGEPVSSSMVRK